MYPFIEMAVWPSSLLVRCHWAVHILLLLATLSLFDERLVYCLPLWLYQFHLMLKLGRNRFEFQTGSVWRYQNGRWFYGVGRDNLQEATSLVANRLLPFLTVLTFELADQSHHQQIIVRDRVMPESFRQFRVMLKKHQLDAEQF